MDVQDAPTGCYKCGQPGHWSSDCPSESAAGVPQGPDPGASRERRDEFPRPQADGRAAFASAAPGTFHAGARPGGFKKASAAGPGPNRGAPGAATGEEVRGRDPEGWGGDAGRGAEGREGEGGDAAQGAEAPAVRSRNKRKITADMLMDAQDGIPALMRELPAELKLKGGRGNELADLRSVLKGYMRWQKRIFPNASFVEFAEKVEKLGSSRHVKLSVRSLLADYDISMGRPPTPAPGKKARPSAPSEQAGAEGLGEGGIGGAPDLDASAPEASRGAGVAAEEDGAAEEEWWAAQQGPDDDDNELEMEPPPEPATGARANGTGGERPAQAGPGGWGAATGGQAASRATAADATGTDGSDGGIGGMANAADGAPAGGRGTEAGLEHGGQTGASMATSGPQTGSEGGRGHEAGPVQSADDAQQDMGGPEEAGGNAESHEAASAGCDGVRGGSAVQGVQPEAGVPLHEGRAGGAVQEASVRASVAHFVTEEDLQAFMDSLDA